MTAVAVVGAGPVGLTLAGRLAQQGVEVTVFEAMSDHAGEGSRALCMQRETLEIWARLGIGGRVAERGVQWRVGRTYHRGRQLFEVLGERYPDLKRYLETGLAVAIDGEIYQDALLQPIGNDSEVLLFGKIEGG